MAENTLLSLEDFAGQVKPTGAVNRWPKLGASHDVVTYSVYLNGPLAQTLPLNAQEHDYKDVMLHALTEKLWLNPDSMRDNLKVAELVAIRSAWMTNVMNASHERDSTGAIISLPEHIEAEFEQVSKGLAEHPWILGQIEAQQKMSLGLRSVLDAAEDLIGNIVVDQVPDVVSQGLVLSQNEDFTVQATTDGEIVTHENRRLAKLPVVGQEAMVSYYRGQGQVLFDHEHLKISEPYIDESTLDLAVKLIDPDGNVDQVILFNGVSSYAKFVQVEGLDNNMIVKAMNAREATPKTVTAAPVDRTVVSEIYVDHASGCMALDYLENGGKYSAIFGSADALERHGKEFGVQGGLISQARAMERENILTKDSDSQNSLMSALNKVAKQELDVTMPNLEKGKYTGSIIDETTHHVIQNLGQRSAAIHDKRDLDKLPKVGDKLEVNYDRYRAKVEIKERNQAQGISR